MAPTIYYFSGTGNCLHVARHFASASGGRAVNIAGLADKSAIEESSEVIGIVFPTYFGDLPGMVKDFLGKLQITGKPYLFAVATYGVMPGNVLFSLDKITNAKGLELSAGFTLQMPDNAYTKVNFVTPPEQREAMLQASELRLIEIAGLVSQKTMAPVAGKSSVVSGFMSGAMKSLNRNLHRNFRVSNGCTHCGTCAKICPAGNISATDSTVTWGDRCQLCLACFHWCPQQAVQLDKKSDKVARYHHPQVTEKDLMAREA